MFVNFQSSAVGETICYIISIIVLLQVAFIRAESTSSSTPKQATITKCKGTTWDKPTTILIPARLTKMNESLTFNISDSSSEMFCENPYRISVNLSSGADSEVEFSSSSLLAHNSPRLKTYYEPHEYCIQRVSQDYFEISLCLSNCDPKYHELPSANQKKSLKEICITKCCSPEDVMDLSGEREEEPACREAGNVKWTPKIYNSNSLEQMCIQPAEYNNEGENSHHFRLQKIIVSNDSCEIDPWFYYPAIELNFEGSPRSNFRVLDNGSLAERSAERSLVTLIPRWAVYNESSFCVDGMQNFSLQPGFYTGESSHQLFYRCKQGNENKAFHEQQEDDIIPHIYIAALLISLLPLILTLVSYWLTWDSQNIHGWTVFSHIASLLIMNILLGTSHILKLNLPSGKSTASCQAIGGLGHFFFLSTFFWLTMVNLDLWLTFKNLKPSGRSSNGLRHIIAYASFAFGGPLLVVMVGVCLNIKYGPTGVDSDCDIIVPNYGVQRCWLDPLAEGVYLYYIVGMLIFLNLVFFLLTVFALYSYKKGTQNAMQGKSKAEATKNSDLFTRLFIVMGISYTLDFVSWTCNAHTGSSGQISWPWIIIDIINIVGRATFIFIIFACKRKTLNEIKKRCSKSPFLTMILGRLHLGGYVLEDSQMYHTNSMKLTTVDRSRNSSIQVPT